MTLPSFWRDKRIFVTGHTGFKGSWLTLWLRQMGANVVGYALDPPTDPSLFETARVGEGMSSTEADVRDRARVHTEMERHEPEIVLHLAAQPLVRRSIREPVETFETNVLGTANVLEAATTQESVRAVVIVTTDKVYENDCRDDGYREDDRLGGHDPYSASKACAELVTESFRISASTRVAIASARSGNVIGGGDWSEDRLVPDLITSAADGTELAIRHPEATRPWQHVLDCLHGYICLVERLWDDPAVPGAWNFGPSPDSTRTVEWIVRKVISEWEGPIAWHPEPIEESIEMQSLQLNSSKAESRLGWRPLLGVEEAVRWTVSWYQSFLNGDDARELCEQQLARFHDLARTSEAAHVS